MRVKRTQSGSALLIALAFVVLLTGLILAFFSRSVLEEQVSTSSANQVKAENFAMGAVATTISDLKQEIEAGSSRNGPNFPITGNYKTFYYSIDSTTVIMSPAVTGSASGAAPGSTFGSYKLGQGAYANLLKISQNNQKFYPAFYPYGAATLTDPLRAAPVSTGDTSKDTTGILAPGSTNGSSLNNRYISGARWNKPLLLPPIGAATGDITAFPLPDWIYVYRSPAGPNPLLATPNPTTWPASPTVTTDLRSQSSLISPGNMAALSPVVGRYAYAIYDEGGLLDINVAGTPSQMPAAFSSYKSAEAFADLTTIGLTQPQIDTIVGWRNNASASSGVTTLTGTVGNYTGTTSGYTWTAANATNYYLNVVANPNGFLQSMSPSFTPSQTDQGFTSRQQLIQFFNQVLKGSTNNTVMTTLQYLTHFSRGLEQPSYAPPSGRPTVVPLVSGGNNAVGLDSVINPSYLANVIATSFTRNDGSTAIVGEPLVKKRFALNRLQWLTYKGPICDGTSTGSTVNADADIQKIATYLETNYGFSVQFLKQGTAANIQKYFGLTWQADTLANGRSNGDGQNKWFYNVHCRTGATAPFTAGSYGAIMKLGDITGITVAASQHEADFFELLKSAITVGSLGKAADTADISPATSDNSTFQNTYDYDVDYHIIQIGANIIEQSHLDAYPVRIIFDDGSGKPNTAAATFYSAQEFTGADNYPYLSAIRGFNIKLSVGTPDSTGYYSGTVTATDASSRTIGPVGSGAGITAAPIAPNCTTASSSPVVPPPLLTAVPVAAVMEAPTLWNPYDPNCPLCAEDNTGAYLTDSSGNALFPQRFRIGAETCPPGGTPIGGYAYLSQGSTAIGNSPAFVGSGGSSINATSPLFTVYSNTVGNAGYTLHSRTITPNNSSIYFNIPSTVAGQGRFREPAVLYRVLPADANNFYVQGFDPTAGGNNVAFLSPQTQDGGAQAFAGPTPSGTAFVSGTLGSPTATDGLLVDPLINNPNNWAGSANTFNVNYEPQVYDPPSSTTVRAKYLGIYLDSVAMAWASPSASSSNTVPNWYTMRQGAFGGLTGTSNSSGSITYMVQCESPFGSGKWATYDQKYTPSDYIQQIGFHGQSGSGMPNTIMSNGNVISTGRLWCDPRTSRFGPLEADLNPPYTYDATPTPDKGFLDAGYSTTTANARAYVSTFTSRPDYEGGMTGSLIQNSLGLPSASTAFGFYGNTGGPNYYPCLLSQNRSDVASDNRAFSTDTAIAPATLQSVYYTDPDGVVRRAAGAYVVPYAAHPAPNDAATYSSTLRGSPPKTAASPGMPLGIATTVTNGVSSYATQASPDCAQTQSRPYILHRPFRSVVELGNTFKGIPWKNLDFFTPESGDSALLDVFCINDTNDSTGLVAGKVNLNTRQTTVIKAILAGAYKDETNSFPTPPAYALPALTSTEVMAAATALTQRTASSGTTFSGTTAAPMVNISSLVGTWISNTTLSSSAPADAAAPNNIDGSKSYDGFIRDLDATGGPFAPAATSTTIGSASANIQRFRQSVIQPLANCGQVRVWNLMIDVIAQTGRFPATAGNLTNFYVEGEKRYWVHIAIDRLTGKVLDQQTEEVKE